MVNLIALTPSLQSIWPLYLVASCWGLTEIVRYSWYALNLVGRPTAMHTWLRYSTFVLLYPAGVLGELLCLRAALPELEALTVLGVSLASVTRYAVFPSYAIGLPLLYSHMLTQRSRALRSSAGALSPCSTGPASSGERARTRPEKEV